MKRTFIISIGLLVSLIIIIASSVLIYSKQWLEKPVLIREDQQTFVVHKGDNVHRIAQRLHTKNILDWPRLWVLYARISDKTNIKAGEYALADSESPESLLALFISGNVIQHSLTLIEGTTFKDVLALLRTQTKLQHTLNEQVLNAFLADLNIASDNPEGWFFPDTYAFSKNDTDISILFRAYHRMQKVLDEEWSLRRKNLPYKTPYDALIMASIIEKETGAPHERAEIAGVFVRRLELGMRLQTDPTVIYGMGEAYNGNITRKDLKTPTPYNTYVIKALPPTPIALVGREAIHAALHPKEGTSLYFVAKGDGTHYFSSTLDEHISAVQRFQKRRTKNYRSNYKQ